MTGWYDNESVCSFAFLRNDSTAIVVAANAIESSLTNEIIDDTWAFLLADDVDVVEEEDDEDETVVSAPDLLADDAADDATRGEGIVSELTDVAVGGDDTPSVRKRKEKHW